MTRDRSAWSREYYRKNKVHRQEVGHAYYLAHRDETLEKRTMTKEEKKIKDHNTNLQLRREIIDHYGGKCECCGEMNWEFLTIDHINGGGGADRKMLGGGATFYRNIIRLGFPEGVYRVLCYNCNMALGHLGYSPNCKEV